MKQEGLMHIHQVLQDKHPIRNTKEQKQAFLQYAKKYATELGYDAHVEELGKKGAHRNLVVGDVEQAKVLFTGHYDTPRTMFLPNLMMPRQIVLMLLYSFLIAMPFLIVSLLLEVWTIRLTGNAELGFLAFMLFYLGTFYLTVFKGPINRNNANDNTSGIATMMRIMEIMPEALKQHVAFVFFDNEEKGKLGSKAFAKAHPDIKKQRMLINLDCVGLGEHFLTVVNKKARELKTYALFCDTAPESEKYAVHHFHSGNTMMNSDQSHFDWGIGIVACKKVPVIGYAAGRIHTNRDTVADTENMDYLAAWMVEFTKHHQELGAAENSVN